MPERWESELHKLRRVEPSDGTWERAQMPPRGDGMPPGRERVIGGIVGAAAFLLVVGLAWAAIRGGGDGTRDPAASVTQSVSVSVTTPPTPTPTPTPSASPTDEPSPTVAQVGDPVDIEDGRYYVRITAIEPGDPPLLTFDLTEFSEGAAAVQRAEADGTTALDGRFGKVYIVNENERLRTFAVDPEATVTYYEEYVGDPTTDLTPFDEALDGLIDGFACDADTPVGPNPMNYDWWITLERGRIAHIEEAMDVVGDPATDGPCTS
jgi:hypothetical protein